MQPAKQFLLILCTFFFNQGKGQNLNYHVDIKPILDVHCVSCHQPGEVGAMPLTNYLEVSAYGKMIQYVTSVKLMPPWYADPAYSHFSNERVLSAAEVKSISDWVEQGMQEGKDALKISAQTSSSGTQMNREPDLVISMAQGFEQYGIYLDQYQVFVLPTQLDEDVWVEGIEFVPGNKKIVRYASISVESSDKFESLDQWDPRYGYYSFGGLGKAPEAPHWYTWSLQQPASFYPKGYAKFLPRGSNLILHMHYGPTGRPEIDSSSIRLYFSSQKPTHKIVTAPLINPYSLSHDSLFIPANTKKIFHASYELPYEIELFRFTPQANLLCRSWELFAKVPGTTEPVKLLKIKDWNFNWKQTFDLPQPIILPKGSVIHALAHYDNTSENFCNPSDIPVPFSWGAHLFNEMFFVHMEYARTLIAEPSVSIRIPSVVTTDSLSLMLEARKKYFVEIQIRSLPNRKLWWSEKKSLTVGKQKMFIDLQSIPHGNYLIQIMDQNQAVIAEQIFTRMWDKGL